MAALPLYYSAHVAPDRVPDHAAGCYLDLQYLRGNLPDYGRRTVPSFGYHLHICLGRSLPGSAALWPEWRLRHHYSADLARLHFVLFTHVALKSDSVLSERIKLWQKILPPPARYLSPEYLPEHALQTRAARARRAHSSAHSRLMA